MCLVMVLFFSSGCGRISVKHVWYLQFKFRKALRPIIWPKIVYCVARIKGLTQPCPKKTWHLIKPLFHLLLSCSSLLLLWQLLCCSIRAPVINSVCVYLLFTGAGLFGSSKWNQWNFNAGSIPSNYCLWERWGPQWCFLTTPCYCQCFVHQEKMICCWLISKKT